MNKLLLSLAAAAFVFVMSPLCAQGTTDPEISSDDTTTTDSHDRPVGTLKMKLPAPATPPATPTPPPAPPTPPTPTPPAEGDDIPPTETPPDPPPAEEPPTYYGEPVQGKFAFVLDASGSMYGSRMATVRSETTGTINQLTDTDEFDCMAYGGQFSPTYVKFMWGALLPATDGNRSSAISWVNGPNMNPGGGTPTLEALQQACQTYPADLDKMFLLTDGYPNSGPGPILSAFPGLWAKFIDCELIAICIGGVGSAQTFMQQLAALAGGTYIQR